MNPWRKTKRNHGLEHATIALLLGRPTGEGRPVAGYSIPGGFFVVGDIPTERVKDAAREALRLMQEGERGLAVSPFCGTTILVTAALATAASVGGYPRAGGARADTTALSPTRRWRSSPRGRSAASFRSAARPPPTSARCPSSASRRNASAPSASTGSPRASTSSGRGGQSRA